MSEVSRIRRYVYIDTKNIPQTQPGHIHISLANVINSTPSSDTRMHYEVSLQSVYARKWWNSVDIHNSVLTLQDDSTSPPSYTNFSIPSGTYTTKSSLAQAFAEALVVELKRVNIIGSSENVTINTEVSEIEQRLIVRLTGMAQI
eukprot:2616774-Pleurochrysis_carterae.AAC.1